MDRERLNEAIGLLNNIISSPNTATTMSNLLNQRQQTSAGTTSTVDDEMRRMFTVRSGAAASGTSAGASQEMRPRYQTQQYFGTWASKPRKRSTTQQHPAFNKDVILLPHPSWGSVCKHKTKRKLHESGYILSGFEIRKIWDSRTVIQEIRDSFKDKIPEDVSVELLMPCGNKLVSPKLRESQELNGFMIHKVFRSKSMYIRPSRSLPVQLDSSDSDDTCVEVDTTSTSSDHRTAIDSQTTALQEANNDRMTTRARGNGITATQEISTCHMSRRARANQTAASQQASSDTMNRVNQTAASQQASSDTMNRANQTAASQQASSDTMNRANQTAASQQAASDTMTRANQTAASQQASSDTMNRVNQTAASQQASSDTMNRVNQTAASQQASSDRLDSIATVSQTPSNYNDDYTAYLSILDSISDVSSDDEELNHAIMASLESQPTADCSGTVSAQELLLNVASQINSNQRCKFNINRFSVLDGAIRGFKRLSYNPNHMMSVKFYDDMGKDEEAVDLGGPRREFLRLLMEALAQSPMFEGREDKKNLALDSTALREDRYFIAGQAIAVSLVHGGPSPGFLAPTLYSCLVGGKDSAKPVLEDIADFDLYEKVKKVSECTSLDDLLLSTEPLQDYLANAGCLRPLTCIEDKDLLVQDVLMFQVVHRVRGAFERFRDGLKTLGVLDAIQIHPDSFRPLMCHEPSPLTADLMDDLFHIRLSEEGSNKRRAEERVVPFWRDYLQDVEEEEGPSKLGKILAFATGASVIPPIGFSPQPSIDFLHEDSSSTKHHLPMANTCINCLKLPLLATYMDFRESMDFALGNTQGFGRE